MLRQVTVHQRLFPPNNCSTFAFTTASILISGGQVRLKPSLGCFFVAAMPSLLPLAISLAAWSSTSDGPLVKFLLGLRQGFGGQARCGLAVP